MPIGNKFGTNAIILVVCKLLRKFTNLTVINTDKKNYLGRTNLAP